jgi:hypothetical protein
MKTFSARLTSLAAIMLLASPAIAAEPAKPAATSAAAAPATPTPTGPAGSSITTPMDDLGLRKEAIPPVLIEAVENPYNLQGLAQCPQIVAKVEALDMALGKDIDLPQEDGSRLAAGDLVNFAASSVIPFRGLIREVTGASSRQRQMQEAVLAGFARRAFLKGVGQTRNCAYPARPANPQIIAAQSAALMASLEQLCGPLPNGQKRTPKEEWLNTRKCRDYKRAQEQRAAAAPPATASTPARSN